MMKKYRKKIAFITIFTFVSFLISSSYPARNDQESVGLNLIKEGETLYSSFKYKESIEKFKLAKKYIKSDKNRYRLYLNLSKSYYALGLKKETEKALKEMFKLKLDQEINEGEFPRGYLEIYHRIEKKYVTPLVSEEEITPKKVTVVEKPGKKKKKKKSPVLIIVVIAAVAVLAVLLGKKKKTGNGPQPPQEPTQGSIRVESSPAGAEIWLDGSNTGLATNATISNVNPGSHTVRLIRDGYEYYETTVQVTAGQQASVSATLTSLGINIEWVEVSAGSFEMGDNFSEGDADEQPVHTVDLDGYFISKYEITFDQYDRFCDDTGRGKPSDNGWGRGTRPVINVSWHDAKAFCDWMSDKTGMNIYLPTEAQWEKAARGTDQRRYPWGNASLSCNKANYGGCNGQTVQVGSYASGVSPYGVHDMAGNVYEWCSDWYDPNYYSSSPSQNPQGPSSGSRKILRGGGCYSGSDGLRSALRYTFLPSSTHRAVGFRICRD